MKITAAGAAAIFHIGHCGSTLLSRLLDSWPQGDAQSRLGPVEASALLRSLWMRWSQPTPPGARSAVKANSCCSDLIAPLLEQTPTLRAILLDQPLRPYLATLLKARFGTGCSTRDR